MGEYKRTTVDDRKDEADILINAANGGSYTVSTKMDLIGRGIKKNYGNGTYEVTESKLKQLQEFYKVECDF